MPTRLEVDGMEKPRKNEEIDDFVFCFSTGNFFCARNIFKMIHIERLGDSTPHTPLSNFLPRRTCMLFLRNGLFIMILQSRIVKKNHRAKAGEQKKQQNIRRCFKTFFFFRSLLSCLVSWPCLLFGVSKFSGARNLIQDFFMIFAFVSAWFFLAHFCSLLSVKYCLMFMRKLCEAIFQPKKLSAVSAVKHANFF